MMYTKAQLKHILGLKDEQIPTKAHPVLEAMIGGRKHIITWAVPNIDGVRLFKVEQPRNNIELALDVFGWQGGTIHQVAEELGMAGKGLDLVYMDHGEFNLLIREWIKKNQGY